MRQAGLAGLRGKPRLRLRPTVEAFAASSGDLYLLRSDGGGDFVLREPSAAARALVAALASGGLPARLSADERSAVDELDAAGLLCAVSAPGALTATDAERYDRQLHYFADQSSGGRSAEEMQRALGAATVVVLGAGGLGSWTMAGLACAGVGRIVTVDDDTVELSNLNRQILYRTTDLGRPKVEVAAEALSGLNPGTEVVALRDRVSGSAGVRALARDAAFVVCTADSPAHAIDRWVDEACLELGMPHISAAQFPPRIRVGPTFVPGRTACLGCQERRIRRDFPLYDELVEQRMRAAPVAATLGAASGLIGSLIAMEVIHALTGICEPATLGRALVLDLRDLSTSWEEVEADPGCERCGGPG